MQKWEYKVLYTSSDEERELNKLGGLGWELVGFFSGTYWFKRPKQ